MAQAQVIDALGTAFRLVFRNLGAYLATQGLFIVAASLLSLGITLSFQMIEAPDFSATSQDEDPFPLLQAWFMTLIPLIATAFAASALAFFLGTIALGLGAVVTDDLLRGERPGLGRAWSRFSPRLGNLLLTSLAITALLLLGGALVVGAFVALFAVHPLLTFFGLFVLLAFLVVAVYLAVRWFVVVPVSVLEERGVVENFSRASDLSRGQRGPLLGLFLLLILIGIGVGIALSIPPLVAGLVAGAFDPASGNGSPFAGEPTWFVVFSWVFDTIGQLVTGFLGAAASTIVYRQITAPEPAWGAPPGHEAGVPPGAPMGAAPAGAAPPFAPAQPVTYVNLQAERERVLEAVAAARRHAQTIAARAPDDPAMADWSRKTEAWLQAQDARARQAADVTELRRIEQDLQAHVFSAR